MKTIFFSAFAATLLLGCAAPDELVAPATPPSSQDGYVAAIFSGTLPAVGEGAQYAFVFTETKSGKEHTLPFFASTDVGYQSKKMRLIQVPPGHYHFVRWAVYRTTYKEILAQSKQAPAGLNDFDVSASRVTYIGHYKASDQYAGVSGTTYVVTPISTSHREATEKLAAEYPGYALINSPP